MEKAGSLYVVSLMIERTLMTAAGQILLAGMAVPRAQAARQQAGER